MLNACSKEAPRVRNLATYKPNFGTFLTRSLFTDGDNEEVTSPFTLQPFTYLRVHGHAAQRFSPII
jgi:hypothetical protein